MDPLNNPNDFDRLVDIVSEPIHQSKRGKVLQSHLTHAIHFKERNRREFLSFITKKYLQSKASGKKPSAMYIFSIVQTLQRSFNVNHISKHDVFRVFSNLNKLYNGENPDDVFFTSSNQAFSVQRDAKSSASDVNGINEPMYSDEEYAILKTYFGNHLENFLSSSGGIKQPSKLDELSLVVTILCSTPYRISEVINLTLAKAQDLIIKSTTEIKSKSGTGVVDMIFPVQLSSILDRFVSKLPIFDGDMNLFSLNYNQCYRLFEKQYKFLMGKSVVGKRSFHSFRNRFARVAAEIDIDLARRTMNHSSLGMTQKYVNRQKMRDQRDNIKINMNKMYSS